MKNFETACGQQGKQKEYKNMSGYYVIVGSSAAGIQIATKLCASGEVGENSKIIIITAQHELPYNTCFLVEYLTGEKTEKQLYLKSPDFFEKNSIIFIRNTRVIELLPEHKQLVCDTGLRVTYTKLFIATGAAPMCPPWLGDSLVEQKLEQKKDRGIFLFHTLCDVLKISDWINKQKNKRVIIIGAGVTGLECADALWKKGYQVLVIEQSDRILNRVLDPEGAEFFTEIIRNKSVELYLQASVSEILKEGESGVLGVKLADGRIISGATVICAVGVKPVSGFACHAGLDHSNGALRVNNFMQVVGFSDIYAAGDVCEITDRVTGLPVRSCMWPDAIAQANHAVLHVLGKSVRYEGAFIITNTHLFGYEIHATGLTHVSSWGSGEYKLVGERSADSYKKVVLDITNVVRGFVLIGAHVPVVAYKRSLVLGTPLG